MRFEYLDQPAASPRAPIKFEYLDSAPAPSPAHVTAPKVPSATWYMEPLGPLEAAANMGVNTAASVAGGLGALADAPLYAAGISKTSPADVVHAAESFAGNPIFQPETATGKALLTAASWPFKKLAQGARAAGNYVLDKTGSPVAAAAVDTAIQGIPIVAGAKLPESALVKGTEKSRAAANLKRAEHTQSDEAIRTAKRMGYRLQPSEASPGLVNNALEGMGGSAKSEKRISAQNQAITDAAAREALGLPPDTPLTPEMFDEYREQQGRAYESVSNTGMVHASKAYREALREIGRDYVTAEKSFPGLSRPEIAPMLTALNRSVFSAKAALAAMRELRASAKKAFAQHDGSLGNAYRKASDALEGELERHLERVKAPASVIENFRNARRNIAKSHAVENALDRPGHVDARKLAKALGKGAPLSGPLRDVANVASQFGKSLQPIHGVPWGWIEYNAAPGGYLAHLLGGSPAQVAATVATLGMRPALRALVSSRPYQALMVRPGTYAPGVINPSFARFLATYTPAATASAQQEQ